MNTKLKIVLRVVEVIILFSLLSCNVIKSKKNTVQEVLSIIENQQLEDFRNLSNTYSEVSAEELAYFSEMLNPFFTDRPVIEIEHLGDELYGVLVKSTGLKSLKLNFEIQFYEQDYKLAQDFQLSRSFDYILGETE